MNPRDFSTCAVHAGDSPDTNTQAIDEPLVLSNAFAFPNAATAAAIFQGNAPGFVYGRWASPNATSLEAKVAALEGAESAVALASGMSAVFGAVNAHVSVGAHVVAPLGLYAETGRILRGLFAKFGVETSFVDMGDLTAVEAVIQPNTSLIWTETPANPTLAIYDLRALADLAHTAGAKLVADNTFATPFHQRPLVHGADLVVHAATKGLGGHGDAIGGIVCGDSTTCQSVRDETARAVGATMSPFVAWLIARGVRTLALRAERSASSAMELALRLEAHPAVDWVRYPGLASHPDHELASRQMSRGYGALIAFQVHGGLERGTRVHDALELITRAVSLGDVRSLITHPASTTHQSMSPDSRAAAQIGDGLMRLSVGVEGLEDLWSDLERALSGS